jgi:HNH endonuclease
MPRELFLKLEFYGKDKSGYKAGYDVAWILTKHGGWQITKETRNYTFLMPSEGVKAGKKVDIKLSAPTDDEIIEIANRMREAGVEVSIVEYGWPFHYIPKHQQSWGSTPIDGFTLERGETVWTTSEIAETCKVGFLGIWQVEVWWKQNTPTLRKYAPCEIAPFSSSDDTLFESENDGAIFEEGLLEKVLKNDYERNLQARKKCIEHYGVKCQVCGLDFGERYGEIGKGFIHVHHLKPISEIGHRYQIDPIKDLRPVCPNCHFMLHRKSPPMSIEELKKLLN